MLPAPQSKQSRNMKPNTPELGAFWVSVWCHNQKSSHQKKPPKQTQNQTKQTEQNKKQIPPLPTTKQNNNQNKKNPQKTVHVKK